MLTTVVGPVRRKICKSNIHEIIKTAITAANSLLSSQELNEIEKAMTELEARLAAPDHRAIKQAADALNRATDEFAARRMDAGIKRALAGRQIGSL